MVTFNSRITKGGNVKISAQLREILGLEPNDRVTVTLDCESPEELKIPSEFLDEAGIPEGAVLEVYAENGRVIVQEACDETVIYKTEKAEHIPQRNFRGAGNSAAYKSLAHVRDFVRLLARFIGDWNLRCGGNRKRFSRARDGDWADVRAVLVRQNNRHKLQKSDIFRA